jgi:uncharacterized protein YkwD
LKPPDEFDLRPQNLLELHMTGLLRRLALMLLAAPLAACLVVPIPIPISAISAPVAVASGPGSTEEFGVLLNRARAAEGVGPVVLNPSLTAAAQAQAQDLVVNNYFSHTGLNGSTVSSRARAAGYRFCLIAENIANGRHSAADVLGAWQASPGHRHNNMLPRVNEYGIGHYQSTWVLLLGRRC